MRRNPIGVLSLGMLLWASSAAGAYDAQIGDNLNRSRQALLDQRAHLQETYDRLNQRVDELQKQLDVVAGYMRDTDSALRDVENAMRR